MDLPAGVSTSTYTHAGTGYANPHAVTQIATGFSTTTYGYDAFGARVYQSASSTALSATTTYPFKFFPDRFFDQGF